MARINLGNFGNALAQPVGMQTIKLPDSGRQQDWLLQGASNFEQAYESEKNRQYSMQNAKDVELYNNQMRGAWSDVYREASDGRIEPQLAYDEYERRRLVAREGILNGVQDESRRKLLDPILDLASIRLDGEARAGQVQITTNSNRKNLSDTLGLLRKESLADLSSALTKADVLIRGGATGAGYTPAQASEMLSAVGNDLTYDSLSFQIEQIGVGERAGAYQQLNQIASDLSDPAKYASLTDGGKRATLLRQIDSRKNDLDRIGREAKAEQSAADAREFKSLSILFESGGYTTTDAQNAMQSIAARNKDNPLGERANELIQSYSSLRNFTTKPLATQEKMLQEQKALSLKGENPAAQAMAAKNAEMYERALAYNNQQFQRNPYGHYQAITGQIAPPLDIKTTEGLVESITARRPFADKVSGFFGRPVGVLAADEAKAISESVAMLPASQQENFIKAIVNITDEQSLGMIGKANPSLMVAGAAYQKGVVAFGDIDASTVVLNGKKMLDEKKFDGKGSFDASFEKAFQDKLGGAFSLANADDMLLTKETLKQSYAFYASSKGIFNPEDIDDDLFDAASSVLNPVTNFNSRTTFVPVGTNPDAFEDSARKSLAEIAKRNGYDKAKARHFINNAQLVQIRDNAYLVYDEYGQPIINETGAGLQTLSVGW